MEINILAGGPQDHIPSLHSYSGEWVGVDRGVLTLINEGIFVDKAFGDFDSVKEEELAFIKKHVDELFTFPPEKDETDMEIALSWAMKQAPKKIRIFGATGGRLDHFFANIQLLLKPMALQKSVPIELIDRQNIISLIQAGTHTIERNDEYTYISFIPFHEEVEGLTLVGFKYPLTLRHIPIHSTLCISNELISDIGTISFSEGILMVIRSRD
ncbi:thiamine diphosphokinase [Robertmurraya korlensis]|uniref:thiamine diphosphokinase n=1 Tax=Robertmurraya korlensis TaxID=519977 RepID=UPI00203E6C6E|nr:thiamine diphosphokinase [Robertmurraya korlensis]MCM3600233.1 thiamine diphosphokinase [Robertmurraya korlensis]